MKVFTERAELYFLANHVEPKRRQAMLLHAISDEEYKKLREAFYPADVKDKTYEELMYGLNELFGYRRALLERKQFYRSEQMEDETAEEWLKRIQLLVETCDFSHKKDTIIRDRFISGLRSEAAMDRLCDEKNPNMSLERALEICVGMERNNLN